MFMIAALLRLPKNIWLIGLISLCNDSASEMLKASKRLLLPTSCRKGGVAPLLAGLILPRACCFYRLR